MSSSILNTHVFVEVSGLMNTADILIMLSAVFKSWDCILHLQGKAFKKAPSKLKPVSGVYN